MASDRILQIFRRNIAISDHEYFLSVMDERGRDYVATDPMVIPRNIVEVLRQDANIRSRDFSYGVACPLTYDQSIMVALSGATVVSREQAHDTISRLEQNIKELQRKP